MSPRQIVLRGGVRPEVAEELRARVEAGESDEEIAEGTIYSTRTVASMRKAAGLYRGTRPAPAVSDDRIRALHADGAPHAEIAAETGLAIATVRSRCCRLGLRANPPRQRRQFAPLHLTSDELDWAKDQAREAGFPSVEPWVRSLMGLTG